MFIVRTHLPSSHLLSLFPVQRIHTSWDIVELDETVCLLDCHLRQPAVFVEDMKQIPLRHLFGR